MAKFHGIIGYGSFKDQGMGVEVLEFTERPHTGDILKNVSKNQNGEGLNDNIVVSNQISILSDAYSDKHFHEIKYAVMYGIAWKVLSVEVLRPRLLLTLGGVCNAVKPKTP